MQEVENERNLHSEKYHRKKEETRKRENQTEEQISFLTSKKQPVQHQV